MTVVDSTSFVYHSLGIIINLDRKYQEFRGFMRQKALKTFLSFLCYGFIANGWIIDNAINCIPFVHILLKTLLDKERKKYEMPMCPCCSDQSPFNALHN